MEVIWPKPGKYVIAVSGGVDSCALLYLLHKKGGYKLTVAHLDHGIRPDSSDDRKLVQDLAATYELPYIYEFANLGPTTSEADARTARYEFLRRVLRKTGSKAILTAHHQDDVLETAIINMIRGTGRKGLTSLEDRPDIARPMLNASKAEILRYAKANNLNWREDSTNQDTKYLRNYIRHQIVPRLSAQQKNELLATINSQRVVNKKIDRILAEQLNNQLVQGTIDRDWFDLLPHEVAKELLATWLRQQKQANFDRITLEQLAIYAKVAAAGKQFPVGKDRKLKVGKDSLALT